MATTRSRMESLQQRRTHRWVTAASLTLPDQAGTLAVSLTGCTRVAYPTEDSTSTLVLVTESKLAAIAISTSP